MSTADPESCGLVPELAPGERAFPIDVRFLLGALEAEALGSFPDATLATAVEREYWLVHSGRQSEEPHGLSGAVARELHSAGVHIIDADTGRIPQVSSTSRASGLAESRIARPTVTDVVRSLLSDLAQEAATLDEGERTRTVVLVSTSNAALGPEIGLLHRSGYFAVRVVHMPLSRDPALPAPLLPVSVLPSSHQSPDWLAIVADAASYGADAAAAAATAAEAEASMERTRAAYIEAEKRELAVISELSRAVEHAASLEATTAVAQSQTTEASSAFSSGATRSAFAALAAKSASATAVLCKCSRRCRGHGSVGCT
jgi:hypothetical protein